MSTRSERIQQIVLTLSALCIAILLLVRTLGERVSTPTRGPERAAAFLEGWREVQQFGRRLGGDANAPVVIIAFSDLECPACRGFHPSLERLLARRGREAQAFYVPFPLPMHRFALPAARAIECLTDDATAAALISLFYTKQDSLGIKSWGGFAQDVGVTDTTSIAACALGTRRYTRIDSGLAVGRRLRIPGTPAVLVNGWLFPMVPSEAELDSAVSALVRVTTK